MKLEDTLKRYGSVSMGFHWGMALMILGMLMSGLIMVNAELPLSVKFSVYQTHKSFGFVIFCLVFLRLLWRWRQLSPPVPAHLPDWQKIGAKASHKLLYFFMIILPLTGWLVVSGSKFKIDTVIFGLFKLPHLPIKSWVSDLKWLNEITKDIHFYVAMLMCALVLAHIAAALKHHLIDKDDVLKRMLPERKSD